MRIEIRNLPEVQRILQNLASEQIPYAISVAINNTCYQVMQGERTEIKNVFDRPTPFVVRGMRYQKSSKHNLTARVYAAETTSKVFEAHVFSGDRSIKTFEAIMRRLGVLPEGRLVVTASGAKLNAYGNIQRTQLNAILDALSGLANSGKSGVYFLSRRSGRTGHLPMGIWEKIGRRIVPVLLFVSQATYEKRYQFYEKGVGIANSIMGTEMLKAAEKAMERAQR